MRSHNQTVTVRWAVWTPFEGSQSVNEAETVIQLQSGATSFPGNSLVYTDAGRKASIKCDKVAKFGVTKIKICELMGFVEIIQAVKTKNIFLLKISMLVKIVGEILPQLCSNDSIQILLKMVWLLKLGNKPI